jgi:hypothetical protein
MGNIPARADENTSQTNSGEAFLVLRSLPELSDYL